jgi:hypothetical protein
VSLSVSAGLRSNDAISVFQRKGAAACRYQNPVTGEAFGCENLVMSQGVYSKIARNCIDQYVWGGLFFIVSGLTGCMVYEVCNNNNIQTCL